MNSMDMFTFEDSPWEIFSEKLENGSTVSAAQFLALLEGEAEESLENAFQKLEDLAVSLDISELPKAAGTGEAAIRLRREEQLVKQGTLLSALDKSDPLGLYLQELASIPVCGDVKLLSEQLAEGADEALQTKLVNLSLSRVVELAGEFTGYGVLLMDLIQEGSLGLWQGILAWTGGDFETHRDWWIRQYMIRAVVSQARQSGVGQKMRQALEDYRAVDERLLSDLGRNPTLEEIAQELHMSPEEAETVKKMLDNARLLNKAKPAEEPEEEPEEEERHVEDTALFQMRQRILDLLSGLSEADAKLLTLRFGLEGGLPMSPEEAGRKLGLTAEEVVAREAAALSRLRNS